MTTRRISLNLQRLSDSGVDAGKGFVAIGHATRQGTDHPNEDRIINVKLEFWMAMEVQQSHHIFQTLRQSLTTRIISNS